MALRDLIIANRWVLPAALMTVRYSRSGGPGGQNVNKVSSKVELRFDLEGAAPVLGEGAVARAREKLANRLDQSGRVLITSSEHRDAPRNLEAALMRMEALIEEAIAKPKPRVATRASRGSKERRLADKKRRAETKRTRGSVDD